MSSNQKDHQKTIKKTGSSPVAVAAWLKFPRLGKDPRHGAITTTGEDSHLLSFLGSRSSFFKSLLGWQKLILFSLSSWLLDYGYRMIIVKANMIVAMIIVILIYPNLSFLLLFIRMFGVGVLFWLLLCSSSSSSSSSSSCCCCCCCWSCWCWCWWWVHVFVVFPVVVISVMLRTSRRTIHRKASWRVIINIFDGRPRRSSTGKAFQRSAISNLASVQLQKSHAESCAINATMHPSVGQATYLGICAQFTRLFVGRSVWHPRFA